ncbi:uncharacterized protein METZ01_LOCUS200076, partial [marine metagenome]
SLRRMLQLVLALLRPTLHLLQRLQKS